MDFASSMLPASMTFFADASGAVTAMREYVWPTMKVLASLAAIASVFFIVNAGYLYMTSSGKPEKLEQAKHVLKNALLGLIIIIAAVTLTSILTNAYGTPQGTGNTALPTLEAIPASNVDNGLVDILIKAVTGFLNNIIQAIASPFLGALDYFTKSTPLMAQNPSVFNFWLAMVGIADVLLIIVIALIGFHVMSASTFGFEEIEFKHLLPRIGLIFLLMNTSIFFIDGIIALSNALIGAVGKISGTSSVWATLTEVVKQSGGQGLAALLMMVTFLIFSVILLVYYVGRLVVLFIGAVLSPIVAMIWLIPGFRDFAETAFKTYFITVFVLFVHVVILQLSASLFTGMAKSSGNDFPDTLMAMVLGLATILVLLKTQGVMMQFSYVSMGARNMRKLGGQFMNGVSYLSGQTRTVMGKTSSTTKSGSAKIANSSSSSRSSTSSSSSRSSKAARADDSRGVKVRRVPEGSSSSKAGTSSESIATSTPRSSSVNATKKE